MKTSMNAYKWAVKVTYPDGSSKITPFMTKKSAEDIIDFIQLCHKEFRAELVK